MSAPGQVADLFYDRMGLPLPADGKKSVKKDIYLRFADEKVVADEEAAAIDEEAAMDEAAAIDEEAEAEKKPVNQNKKRVIIAVVVSVAAIAAIFVCTFFAVKLALQDHVGEMIFDPNGAYAQNDVSALSDYSVPEATPADENMMTVIAVDRDGKPAMTNADMQIWYWNEFTSFMQQYGSYASMFGLDYNSPLSSQPSLEENLSWEQMFLKSAATNKSVNYALAQAGPMLMPQEGNTSLTNTAFGRNFSSIIFLYSIACGRRLVCAIKMICSSGFSMVASM